MALFSLVTNSYYFRPDNMSDWSLEARAACLAGTVGEGFARKLIIAPNKDEVRFAHSPALSIHSLLISDQ